MTKGKCHVIDIYDDRPCRLGEGVLWHPLRDELFWVDIPDRKVMSNGPAGQREHQFDEMVSALGWIDKDTLLLATESGLYKLTIADWATEKLVDIEADQNRTRSNDGRADPWGGFWIGTMSKSAKKGAGSFYRYYKGELRQLITDITVTNGLCFDRERCFGYFTDSAAKTTWRMTLDVDGWPKGEGEIFLDYSAEGTTVDGAIIDKHGHMLAAIFDGAAVQRISPEGTVVETFETQTPRATCPAFGGPDYRDLFVTTAAVGLDEAGQDAIVHGTTLRFAGCVEGTPEPAVILP